MKRLGIACTIVSVGAIGFGVAPIGAVDSSDSFTAVEDCSIPGILVTIQPDRSSERFDIFLDEVRVFADVPGEVSSVDQSYPIQAGDGTHVVVLTGPDLPDDIAGNGPVTVEVACGGAVTTTVAPATTVAPTTTAVAAAPTTSAEGTTTTVPANPAAPIAAPATYTG